jgi:hypothetical protein
MKVIKIKAYTYAELSQSAQRRAFEKYRSEEFDWSEEMVEAIRAFYKEFDCIDYSRDYTDIVRKDRKVCDLEGLVARRYFLAEVSHLLWRKKMYTLPNGKTRKSRITVEDRDCPLTGMCIDYSLLEPIRSFIARPKMNTTVEDVLRDCVESWRIAYQNEEEYSSSESRFIEDCDANEWIFTEEGVLLP